MKKFISAILFAALAFSASAENLGDFHRGADSLIYTGYAPLADKPVTLYYYIPTGGNIKKMPVLISFHGAERQGRNPRECWRDLAERDGFVVLCPEFSKEYYDENAYQFGNVFKDRTMQELNPESLWTYSMIEPIFDYFQQQTGNKAKTYSIQGHSAGGQYTHRYLLAKPDARVDIAVASNPGGWTWLTEDGTIGDDGKTYGWPYTVKGTPFADARHIETMMKRYMIVHLGDNDILTSGPHVPTSPEALAQGEHRYARGLNFFAQMKEYAKKRGCKFNWDIAIVKGVGHRGKGMVYGLSYRDKDGKRQYSVDLTRDTGAYELIFGSK